MAHTEETHNHIVSPKLYVGIFLFLMVMTALTVFAATINFGIMNPVIALVIATAKATTVILFFMHIKYSTRLTQIVILSTLFFLFLLLGLTLTDYLSRAWMAYPSR
ncbi:Caa(3)-type oxidase, subunit IV [Candidatus Koribacter versatilis Ellin345]|uniref:Caa(3)-type oxidase, subunit IV n=1 Tax=Koribacter versatilis (strain Ellin345) TaxID=204669 RepID=Q1IMA6_KORVE|nr:cytochrome C oxidase subunit IV family protein [Candidatus Koribacter versatilis]ABF41994.1 Caa(3)-type oxidase, subunit IV [Candidatus Koribacter versatilis Ellin345]